MRYRQIVSKIALLLSIAITVTMFSANAEKEYKTAELYPIEFTIPIYSQLAHRSALEGVVECEIMINTDGSINIIHSTGHELLIDPVKAALKNWRYASGINRTVKLVFSFHLVEKAEFVTYSKIKLPNVFHIYERRMPLILQQ
jgi:outer membrane biosynthesis protein TonB